MAIASECGVRPRMFDVGVDARLVPGAEIALEGLSCSTTASRMLALCSRSRRRSCDTGAVTEQPLELRIDARAEPVGDAGDRVRVRAAVAPVAVAEIAAIRRDERIMSAVLPGDQLIDRRPKVGADGVATWPRARQQHGAARMIAAGLVVGRHRLGHVEARDQHDAAAEGLEWFRDEREVEVAALLERTPITRRGTVRMPDADEPLDGGRRRQTKRRQRRDHRFEQRQRKRHARTAKKRPPRHVLFRHVHRGAPHQFVLTVRSPDLTRIWNCGLFTTARTMAEKRLFSVAASRAIARIVGMSVYSAPRPIA